MSPFKPITRFKNPPANFLLAFKFSLFLSISSEFMTFVTTATPVYAPEQPDLTQVASVGKCSSLDAYRGNHWLTLHGHPVPCFVRGVCGTNIPADNYRDPGVSQTTDQLLLGFENLHPRVPINSCAPGHRGFMCNNCEDNFQQSALHGPCEGCPANDSAVVYRIVAWAVVFYLFVYITLYMQNGGMFMAYLYDKGERPKWFVGGLIHPPGEDNLEFLDTTVLDAEQKLLDGPDAASDGGGGATPAAGAAQGQEPVTNKGTIEPGETEPPPQARGQGAATARRSSRLAKRDEGPSMTAEQTRIYNTYEMKGGVAVFRILADYLTFTCLAFTIVDLKPHVYGGFFRSYLRWAEMFVDPSELMVRFSCMDSRGNRENFHESYVTYIKFVLGINYGGILALAFLYGIFRSRCAFRKGEIPAFYRGYSQMVVLWETIRQSVPFMVCTTFYLLPSLTFAAGRLLDCVDISMYGSFVWTDGKREETDPNSNLNFPETLTTIAFLTSASNSTGEELENGVYRAPMFANGYLQQDVANTNITGTRVLQDIHTTEGKYRLFSNLDSDAAALDFCQGSGSTTAVVGFIMFAFVIPALLTYLVGVASSGKRAVRGADGISVDVDSTGPSSRPFKQQVLGFLTCGLTVRVYGCLKMVLKGFLFSVIFVFRGYNRALPGFENDRARPEAVVAIIGVFGLNIVHQFLPFQDGELQTLERRSYVLLVITCLCGLIIPQHSDFALQSGEENAKAWGFGTSNTIPSNTGAVTTITGELATTPLYDSIAGTADGVSVTTLHQQEGYPHVPPFVKIAATFCVLYHMFFVYHCITKLLGTWFQSTFGIQKRYESLVENTWRRLPRIPLLTPLIGETAAILFRALGIDTSGGVGSRKCYITVEGKLNFGSLWRNEQRSVLRAIARSQDHFALGNGPLVDPSAVVNGTVKRVFIEKARILEKANILAPPENRARVFAEDEFWRYFRGGPYDHTAESNALIEFVLAKSGVEREDPKGGNNMKAKGLLKKPVKGSNKSLEDVEEEHQDKADNLINATEDNKGAGMDLEHWRPITIDEFPLETLSNIGTTAVEFETLVYKMLSGSGVMKRRLEAQVAAAFSGGAVITRELLASLTTNPDNLPGPEDDTDGRKKRGAGRANYRELVRDVEDNPQATELDIPAIPELMDKLGSDTAGGNIMGGMGLEDPEADKAMQRQAEGEFVEDEDSHRADLYDEVDEEEVNAGAYNFSPGGKNIEYGFDGKEMLGVEESGVGNAGGMPTGAVYDGIFEESGQAQKVRVSAAQATPGGGSWGARS